MSWTEVTELVLKAQNGDRAAYGTLVERFQGVVFATAMTRVQDTNEAQELTQEVFVHGMRKLPQLRDPRCFAGWLRRIAARMAINRLTRKGLVRGSEPEFLDSVPGRSESPLESIERSEAKEELREGLKQLKPLDRETLEAFYLRGRSLKQMSREFETPVGTIKRRLHVARLRLKDVLEDGRQDTPNENIPANRPRRISSKQKALAV
ncbi:sigma-70 family RNA polymerase sigma factor [Telmatocola sphagniphila]|uniref:Sigma-70 family RNA polymerase sigma factor n=2 Tax=Telmatocola sphagniphila TaxID=1123043 RepID=A0A8E6EVG9_9BACT|nr:sigma-70 family RNA polymerase sigma factor [Telmatocola sphagniphila]